MRANLSYIKDENLNPCIEEGNLSKKCMKDNFYNSEKCGLYFENYKNCLTFWSKVKFLRNINNVRPILPVKEERERILKKREEGKFVYYSS